MITYCDSLLGITADHLRGGFFNGWPTPPTPETHLKLLEGSSHLVLARDGEAGQVVGYITAISDQVLSAYIPHLEVLPTYRGQGIGSQLVEHMLDQLRHLYMIDLICDPDVQPFYTRFGLRPYSGMIYRNYDRQAGDG